jgi:predicted HNH restriction endonuclease
MIRAIPNELVPLAYELSKKVYEKKISRKEAVQLISAQDKMNLGSATDYISNFKYLVEGRKFARTLNTFSMRYFLENIQKDFGWLVLDNAIRALSEHIEYYEGIQEKIKGRPIRMHNMRGLYDEYITLIPDENKDELEQKEVIRIVSKEGKSKVELLEELRQVKDSDAEIVEIKGKGYKRDNVTIAKIKLLYDFRCQICGLSIRKKDGTRYIEAAHIKPKHLKGCETLDNIILLCPNHHKEFDLGESKVENHTIESIDLYLNGQKCYIEFQPKGT